MLSPAAKRLPKRFQYGWGDSTVRTPAETRPAPIARTSSIVPILKDLEVVIGSCAWLDRTCGELEFAAAREGEEHPRRGLRSRRVMTVRVDLGKGRSIGPGHALGASPAYRSP